MKLLNYFVVQCVLVFVIGTISPAEINEDDCSGGKSLFETIICKVGENEAARYDNKEIPFPFTESDYDEVLNDGDYDDYRPLIMREPTFVSYWIKKMVTDQNSEPYRKWAEEMESKFGPSKHIEGTFIDKVVYEGLMLQNNVFKMGFYKDGTCELSSVTTKLEYGKQAPKITKNEIFGNCKIVEMSDGVTNEYGNAQKGATYLIFYPKMVNLGGEDAGIERTAIFAKASAQSNRWLPFPIFLLGGNKIVWGELTLERVGAP